MQRPQHMLVVICACHMTQVFSCTLTLLYFTSSLLCLCLSLAPIPEAGQASVQPHPAHPGSQGGHEEQPLTVCTDFKMPLTGKSSSLSYWSTHDDHRLTASVIIVFKGGHKRPIHFLPVFSYLWCLVLKLHKAMMCFPCAAARVCLFGGFYSAYYSMQSRNVVSTLQRFKTLYMLRGHIHTH